jgi:group I intron endonuclease
MITLISLEEILLFNNNHYFDNIFYCEINGKKYNFIKGYLTYNPRKYNNINFTVKNDNFGTYLIRNLDNGKTYIGSSGKIYNRITKHKNMIYNKNHDNHIFTELLKTSNLKDYELIVFFSIDREEAYNLEQYFVNKYKDSGLLINIAQDVRNTWQGMKLTSDHVKKIILKNIGKKRSVEVRTKMSGRVITDEAKAKLSIFHKTDKKANEHFNKILDDKKKPISVNGIEYSSISEAGLKSPYSESFIRRHLNDPLYTNLISLDETISPLKGRTISENHKKRLSDIRKNDPRFIKQLESIRDLTKKKIMLNEVLYDSITDAMNKTGIHESTIRCKLRKSNRKTDNGHYVLNYVKPVIRKVIINGVIYDSVRIASQHLGISLSCIKSQIKSGKIKCTL